MSAPQSVRLPPRRRQPVFLDVDGRGAADLVCKRSVGLRERLARVLHDGVDRARREFGAEQLAQQLCGVAPRDAVPEREGGDRRLQARAAGSRRHAGRQFGAHGGAAVGATQPLPAMLAEDDRDRRQLRDLVARRLANGAALCLAEAVAAGATLGPVVDELIDALKRKQGTASALVAELAPTLSARAWLVRSRRRRGRILRGWQRGVARTPVEALLELCQAGLQPPVRLNQLIDSHQQGERRLPVAIEDRLCLGPLHTGRVRRIQEGPCSATGPGDLNAYLLWALFRTP